MSDQVQTSPGCDMLPHQNGQARHEKREGKEETKPDKLEKQVVWSLEAELERFLGRIHSLEGALPSVIFVLVSVVAGEITTSDRFLRKKGERSNDDIEGKLVEIPCHAQAEWEELQKSLDSAGVSLEIILQTFVLAIVSQYDAFLNRLICCLYMKKPQLLNSSDKQMGIADILAFKSLEDAKSHILEKEVEGVIRKSHTDHFKWMEGKFGLELRKGLPIWPTFIELTERRNLFAHCNGIVSSQYRAVCEEAGAEKDKLPEIGTVLSVPGEYFRKACSCMFEIGVKLTHVLWRKVLPEERKDADAALNQTIFQLIVRERYDLAITLGKFAVNVLKSHSSEQARLYFLLNLAQSYKWSGDGKKCQETIDGIEWSHCSTTLRMASALLRDDYAAAAGMMRAVSVEGDVKEHDYNDWPIFRDFRKQDVFLKTYQEVYGKPFSSEEKTPHENRHLFRALAEHIFNSLADMIHRDVIDYCI